MVVHKALTRSCVIISHLAVQYGTFRIQLSVPDLPKEQLDLVKIRLPQQITQLLPVTHKGQRSSQQKAAAFRVHLNMKLRLSGIVSR